MGFKQYLGAFLISAAAFLYSPSLYAQDVQQKVVFKDSAAQARKTPNRNLEGKISICASREDRTKLVLEVSAKDCEIRTGFSEFYIGLPGESDITELKQTAKVNERTQDSRGYEEKWIDLAPNEAFKKTALWVSDWGLGHVPIPLLSEAMGRVSDEKETRTQSWARQMKKRGLFMEELSPHYPKMPAAHSTNITRRYEISLDLEPSKAPEARMQICLQDQYERTVTINDISAKFDGKSQIQQVQQSAKPNVPASLEKFLLDDPNLKFVKFWGPKEIGDAFQVNVEDNYIVRYEYTKGGLVLEECSFFGNFRKMAAARIPLRELSEKDILVKIDGLYCPLQMIDNENSNYEAVLYFRFDDKLCKEMKESIKKTGDRERIESFNLLIDDFVKKISTTVDSFKKKGEVKYYTENMAITFNSLKKKGEVEHSIDDYVSKFNGYKIEIE